MGQCITENVGDYRVIRLGGEVDMSWSQEVRKAVLDALDKSPRVAVNLAGVSYIDSSGIAALVEGFQRARGKGQSFVLVECSSAVLAVLKLARLDKVFTLRERIED
ncbi:STAS domain-containing protein [Pseudomarimonas salicorniae]|uniref:Anti-sigma factor antagonist n=1 Tax=Pseudomarimonas salicorniae TaxID=2933270 RepID=A0ABT0GIB1_9GAMM|nr:STAS domain-containing protein [Lysobacter sp. CAU 1642]MCK7593909.1 STAS domain-containing protein [Lysobacter sp. CAU 1642]